MARSSQRSGASKVGGRSSTSNSRSGSSSRSSSSSSRTGSSRTTSGRSQADRGQQWRDEEGRHEQRSQGGRGRTSYYQDNEDGYGSQRGMQDRDGEGRFASYGRLDDEDYGRDHFDKDYDHEDDYSTSRGNRGEWERPRSQDRSEQSRFSSQGRRYQDEDQHGEEGDWNEIESGRWDRDEDQDMDSERNRSRRFGSEERSQSRGSRSSQNYRR